MQKRIKICNSPLYYTDKTYQSQEDILLF